MRFRPQFANILYRLILACACLWLPGLTGCADRSSEPPNVLLLTLDTTRADRIGCYGYRLDASPTLDRLARQGVRFAEVRCQVPITLPSHTSILTGTYPPTHGVHQHTDRFAATAIPTLAEWLGERGYRTAAFVAARVLDRRFGLARGFDTYGDGIGRMADGRPADSRRAAAVIRQARDWFTGRPAGPYFAWLHFYDPHLPFEPPEPYASRFAADLYAGEIAYMDAQIGGFLDWLRRRGELKHTIVAVVADHGESLGEHGIRGHTEFTYQQVLRIPLLICWPDEIPAGRSVNRLVRSIDLMPTLLDYLGLPIPDPVEGESLRPVIEGRPGSDRCNFFESRYLENLFGWAPLLGVERWPHKLIRAPRSELYDLAGDPGEMQNVYAAQQPVARELEDLLEEILLRTEKRTERRGAADASRADLDAQTRRALTSLGYVTSGPRELPEQSARTGHDDPKDHVAAVAMYQRIMKGPHAGSVREDLERAEELARLEPDQPVIQKLLGDYAARFGRLEAAAVAYRRAAELAPQDPVPLVKLARLARARGDSLQTRSLLARAFEVAPEDTDVRFEMAAQAARDNDIARAEEHYRFVLAAEPDHLPALSHLSALLILAGRAVEALPLLERSFALPAIDDRELAMRHYLIGRALRTERDRHDDAVRNLEAALSLAPEMPGPHFYLALTFAQMGRHGDAAKHARRYLQLQPSGPGTAEMSAILGKD